MVSTESRAFVPRIATAERQPSEVKMSGRDFILHVCYVWVCMGMYGYCTGCVSVSRWCASADRARIRHTSNFSNPAGRVSPLG